MNATWEWWGDPLTNRIGCVLLHSLWQGVLAAAILRLLRLLMRQNSAHSRYLASCAVLLLTAAAPVLTFLFAPSSVLGANASFSELIPLTSKVSSTLAGAKPYTLNSTSFQTIQTIAPWLVNFWMIGVLISLLRLAHGYLRLQNLSNQPGETLNPSWFEILEDLKCRLNVSRPVRLLQSALVEVPMVIGWLRPVILLPASSVVGLAPSQLEAILAHELAHIRRHDYLVNLFQAWVESLMFYHPAVWWISRCIREERENCCDDLVMGVCEDPGPLCRCISQAGRVAF
jgi:beta-lactamase regulating signal transducer with metallopeptidase domain